MDEQRVVFHFWQRGENKEPVLYEVDYCCYPNAVGLYTYAKVHLSERPCRCPQEQQLAWAA